MHDPLAIGYLLQPALFDVVDAYVQVETQGNLTRGRTVGNLRVKHPSCAPNARVCVRVDAERFLGFFSNVSWGGD